MLCCILFLFVEKIDQKKGNLHVYLEATKVYNMFHALSKAYIRKKRNLY